MYSITQRLIISSIFLLFYNIFDFIFDLYE